MPPAASLGARPDQPTRFRAAELPHPRVTAGINPVKQRGFFLGISRRTYDSSQNIRMIAIPEEAAARTGTHDARAVEPGVAVLVPR